MFLTMKLYTYAKLNRTDYLHKNGFGVKKLTKVDMPYKPTNQIKPLILRRLLCLLFDISVTQRIFALYKNDVSFTTICKLSYSKYVFKNLSS